MSKQKFEASLMNNNFFSGNMEDQMYGENNFILRQRPIQGDRFINKVRKNFFVSQEQPTNKDMISSQAALDLLYQQSILEHTPIWQSNNMQFINQSNLLYRIGEAQHYSSLLTDKKYFELQDSISSNKYMRKIPKTPCKVLDAPQLLDDFYLNLIDWSSSNILGVALNQCVYLWDANTLKVTKLLQLYNDQVASVAWSLKGPLLGIGTKSGHVQIWDTNKLQHIRTYKGHVARVGTLSFAENVFSSGSRDKLILQRDLRMSNYQVQKMCAHKQEVCGLKWSFDSQLLASGGNDNKLCVWTPQQPDKPIFKFSEHQAAVKAIAWSPHQHGLLVSGGGTADKMIRYWNALEGLPLQKEDTGSQICNLMFSKIENELISTHGYSLNQIILWKCDGMRRVSTLTGHSSRVLYLAMSPDGSTIVTGAGDETLRFWNIYPQPEYPIKQDLLKNISLR